MAMKLLNRILLLLLLIVLLPLAGCNVSVSDPTSDTGTDTGTGTGTDTGTGTGTDTGTGTGSGSGSGTGGGLPTITFSANKTTITEGESITLSWSVSNADQCRATDAWSGLKNLEDSQIISTIVKNSDYTLTCDGPGGQNSQTVSVAVVISDDVINGSIDSSYIDRAKQNTIYVYKGAVTPDDYDGDAGDPYQAVPVTQVENSCAWQYSIGLLPAGEYTLAFTTEADMDTKGVDDTLVFDKVVTVTKSNAGLTQDFAAHNILRVGTDKPYKTVMAAAAAANAGDVIEIDAGTYVDDIVVWRNDNLTLRGVGGMAHMQATVPIAYTPGNDQQNGMGIWVTKSNNIKVENIEFSGAKVPPADGYNGAGIRAQGSDLTICNGYFHDNEDGILGGKGRVHIEYSEFDHNGLGEYGKTHNIYLSRDVTRFVLQHSYSHHAYIGHNVKSRAQENYILYNRIMDEDTGQSSYAVDISNGGQTYIIGNLIQQGNNTDNNTIVSYGAEGLQSDGRTHNLYMVNNTVVNDKGKGTFVYVRSGTATAELMNNIFTGGGTVVNGTANQTTNLVSDTPGLQDRSAYDYHLKSDSGAVNAGTNPGMADGFDLQPYYQYLHKTQREPRQDDGQIDIGAYEYQ